MSRIAYVNGRYKPHNQAFVHIEDRGYQFADGVYEVVALYKGHLLDEHGHLNRLQRSMAEMRLNPPVTMDGLKLIMLEIKKRNLLETGLIYIQVTRGVATRYHPFPDPAVPCSLVVTAKHMKVPNPKLVEKGISIIAYPEIRWARCDVKSIALLPNVLAKQAAIDEGAGDAWFVDKAGYVTEASASNAWIITQENVLQTRPLDEGILGGITRLSIMQIAKTMNMTCLEKPFTIKEAQNAKEAFITSATNYVMPVTKIEGKDVGKGVAGPIALSLRQSYLRLFDKEQ